MNPQHQKMYVLQIGFKLSIFHPPGVEMRSKLSSKSTEKLEVSRSTEHIYIHCSRQHKNMPSDTHMYKRQRHVWESLLNHLHVPIRSSVCGLFKQLHQGCRKGQKMKQRHNSMDVSENSGTPKSSILIGFSIINHPFWGTPIFGNTHVSLC